MPSADLTPLSPADGEPIVCMIADLPGAVAGCPAEITLTATDAIASRWVASVGATVSAEGTATARFELSLGRDCVVRLARLVVRSANGDREWDGAQLGNAMVMLNGSGATSRADVLAHEVALRDAQEQRFDITLGESGSPRLFRVLCVYERLLTQTVIRLPGALLIPLQRGNPGTSDAEMLNATLRDLGWATQIALPEWEQRTSASRPWTLIVFPAVRAHDGQEAAEIARSERDRIGVVLALNRGAGGRPVAVVVEELIDDHASADGYVPEDEMYTGNLVGGFAAGEDAETLLMHRLALSADPVLALVMSLYRQAVVERDSDIAFFRLWSILEVLSTNRVGASPPAVVHLSDGSVWPGKHNTTAAAAPRVYELIRRHLTGIDEASVVQPAASLYEGVRSWYARRNATAHYGAFEPSDPTQRRAGWFAAASRTGAGAPATEYEWVRALREVVHLVVARELSAVGAPLL